MIEFLGFVRFSYRDDDVIYYRLSECVTNLVLVDYCYIRYEYYIINIRDCSYIQANWLADIGVDDNELWRPCDNGIIKFIGELVDELAGDQ